MTVVYINDKAVPLIEGAGGGCFSKDTQISIEHGTISISDIEVGDSVWSYDEIGQLVLSKVTETFYHSIDKLYRVVHDFGYLDITGNHWVLKEDGNYQELKDFRIGDNLLTDSNNLSKIHSIDFLREDEVYNFKVSHLHAYIANGIKVHNGGGGGKSAGGGSEDPNNLFSTDILFITMALGEGPVYRINPNGPQDIEVNEGNIDDLIDYDIGDSKELGGGVKTDRFFMLSNTGTISQQKLPFFGDAVYTPQRLQSGLDLKKGNISGIPRSALEKQATSSSSITAIKFYFICQGMQKQDDSGNIVGSSATVKITIYDRAETKSIRVIEKTVEGKTNVGYSFDIYAKIDEKDYSSNGYKFTVEKTSDDSSSAKRQDSVSIQGWTEITEQQIAYTRTATIGYAIKAYAEHKGSLPAITNMVKGLLVKVPTNYNQPILENGDIDWRQVEVTPTYLTTDYVNNPTNKNIKGGYYQQKTGPILQTIADSQPVIYDGVWDGQFVYSWTQNPAWIIYDMLTNTSYGLGIPEKNIDKYSFYDAAVYCDACDVTTGKFVGVDALADGTYRYKPRGLNRRLAASLLGLESGVSVKERRFILDTVIADQKQVMDIINTLTLTFRAILYYTGGKIALYQDRPDDMPIAVFNETNIIAGTLNISGISEEALLTGVDISYNEAANHYRRETLRVDDSKALRERNYIENIAKVDLTGITRKSQALRLAQYIIAESKYSRRKIGFKTGMEASELYPGAVISVSQKSASVSWGYGGIVANTSPNLNSNVYLEYIGNPSLNSSFFTSNSSPLILRIASSNSGIIDSYLISNNLSNLAFINSGNVSSGYDLIKVRAIAKYNHPTKNFVTFNGPWANNHVPIRHDVWTLGEIANPSNIYSSQSDKLFRIINIKRDKDETVFIEGKEYINNVYIDSDTSINYQPLYYKDFFSPLKPPPLPNFTLTALPKRDIDGSIYNDLEISSFTNTEDYSKEIKTEFFHAAPTPETSYIMVSNTSTPVSTNIINLSLDNTSGITNGISATLLGKNGFSTQAGTIKLLVTSANRTDTNPADPSGNISLVASGLRGLIDRNFNPDTHVLDVISNFNYSLKGYNTISLPVSQYTNITSEPGFINYTDEYNNISARVVGYDLSTDTIKIKNPNTNGTELYNKIPDGYFYIYLNQILNTNVLINSMFVTGSSFDVVRTNTITSTNISDHTFIQPLGVSVKNKDAIRVVINGTTISDTEYSLSTGPSNLANSIVNINLTDLPTADASFNLEVYASLYTVPAIEIGDNVMLSTGKSYGVVATTYDNTSPTYNTWLTSNNVFKITFDNPVTDAYSGIYITNITDDPIGTINNLNIVTNTATFDYSYNTYPGMFKLGNNSIYTLATPALIYKPIPFGDSVARVINRVTYGKHLVRARTVNKYGRRSPGVTKSATVRPLSIKGVSNLSITEELYVDTAIGVATRVIVDFEPLPDNQEVTDYEVSYKVENMAAIDLSYKSLLVKYQTVKISAKATDPDGKLRVRIDNVDVGIANRVNNQIIVRVTPINKNIRGSTVAKRVALVGKTAKPKNVNNFSIGQSLDQLIFTWEYEKNPANTSQNYDLDLKEVEIRRVLGSYDLNTADLTYLWVISGLVAVVNGTDNRKSVSIDQYGAFTYLVKTRDTTGNESTDIKGAVYTSIEQLYLTTYAAYSEDDPNSAFVSGLTNSNYGEVNFPSFANSNNYGFSKSYSPSVPGSFNASVVDNSNGTSTGWSVISGLPTNIKATSGAMYQTQVRDLGNVISGSLVIETSGSQGIKSTWLDKMRSNGSGVTEDYSVGTPPNRGYILRDDNFSGSLGIGHILGYSNTNAATVSFNNENRTLVSGGTSSAPQNVYAIATGSGNFTGDVANANIICFIAGVANSNAIILGKSFYSNGSLIINSNSLINGFSNLSVAGTKYNLVNLDQWADLSDRDNLIGNPGDVVTNVEVRFSTISPYDLEHNVKNNAFTVVSNSDGFSNFVSGLRTFRYFQLRHNIINSNPSVADYTLDTFRYKITLEERTFPTSPTTYTIDSKVKFIDYSSMSFTRVPSITSLIVVSSSNAEAMPQPVVVDRGINGANVSVYFSNGVSAHNIGTSPQINIRVTGV